MQYLVKDVWGVHQFDLSRRTVAVRCCSLAWREKLCVSTFSAVAWKTAGPRNNYYSD
jgi:hypothetical protein